MNYQKIKLRIVKSERIYVQVSNSEKISVSIQLYKEKGEDILILHEQKLGFSLDTEKEEILNNLEKIKNAYIKDLLICAEGKKRSEERIKADETIENVRGTIL